jgi:hypothetical protein
VNEADSVSEHEQAKFDRHDVNVGEADAVDPGEATFDRHGHPGLASGRLYQTKSARSRSAGSWRPRSVHTGSGFRRVRVGKG